MSSITGLREMHAIIGAALEDIDRVYKAQGLAYPSLDSPIYQHAEGNFEPKKAAAEKLTSHPVVAHASNIVYAACNRLAASVLNPFVAVISGTRMGHVTAAISVLEASHIVEILRDAGSQGLHVTDLAREIENARGVPNSDEDSKRLDPVALAHILRLLATCHWIREVQPEVFAVNRISSALDTGKTIEQLKSAPATKYDGTNGAAAFAGMCTKDIFRSMTALEEWLLPSKDKASKPPTAFQLAHRTELDFYSWLERPEHALRLAQVGRAMSIGSQIEGSLGIADSSVLPWDELLHHAVVVDVGGGIGSVAVQLAESYPHLRLIVQDRAQTVAIAPQMWGTKHRPLFDSGRVSFQAQDFFTPQPAVLRVPSVGEVAYPSVYIVTRVLHNWPDTECIKILSHLRAAAGPETKLLIHDVILSLACPETDPKSEAVSNISDNGPALSWPLLLPHSSMADLTMMAMQNGKERTLRELSELASGAGWCIVSVARSDSPVTWGYIAAVPV